MIKSLKRPSNDSTVSKNSDIISEKYCVPNLSLSIKRKMKTKLNTLINNKKTAQLNNLLKMYT